MKQHIEMVERFHNSFKVPVENEPVIPEKERCELRYKLIREELEEFRQAFENGDLVEVADALTDLQYVVFGSVLEFGLQNKFEDLFAEVQRSNMSKLDQQGKPIFREDGKVLKSDLWSPPDLKKILDE
jgi:predicted HAD superfamily Cof-like phosphohydrolase